MNLAELRKEAEWGYRIPIEREWIEWAYNEGLKEGRESIRGEAITICKDYLVSDIRPETPVCYIMSKLEALK